MAVLPVGSGRKVVRALEKDGSRMALGTLAVLYHREVARGTPRSLIRNSGLIVERQQHNVARSRPSD